MIVSVTGSRGFIGQWLVKRLFEEGHEVLPTGGHIPTTMIKTIYFEQDGNCRKFVFPNQKPTKPWTEYEVTCTN